MSGSLIGGFYMHDSASIMAISGNSKSRPVRNIKIIGRYILPGILFSSFAPVLHALDISYGAGLVSEYSSNSLLLPNNEEDEWSNGAELNFNLVETSRHLDANLESQVGYYTYANNTHGDEGRYFLNALATIKIRPERLSWVVRNVLGEEEIDSFSGDSRDNRQRVNLFATGPDLNFQVNPSNSVTIGARWTDTSYEVTKADNTRNILTGGWSHKRSPQLTVAANFAAMMVDFDDNGLNEDYDYGVAYLQADTQFSKTNAVTTFGIFKVDRDRTDDVNDWGAKIDINHQKSSTTAFGWTSIRKVTDSSIEFLEASDAGFVGGSESLGTDTDSTNGRGGTTGDIFLLRRHAAYADYVGPSLSAQVSLYWEDRDYEELGVLDYEEWGVWLGLSTDITAGWRGSFSTGYTNTDNTGISRTDKEVTVELAVDHALTRNVYFSMYSSYDDRDSDDSLAEYREWIVGARLGYQR